MPDNAVVNISLMSELDQSLVSGGICHRGPTATGDTVRGEVEPPVYDNWLARQVCHIGVLEGLGRNGDNVFLVEVFPSV